MTEPRDPLADDTQWVPDPPSDVPEEVPADPTPSPPGTDAANEEIAEPSGDDPPAPPDAGEEPSSDADTMAQQEAAQQAANDAVYADSRRHTRRAFVVAAAGAAAGYGFYQWLANSPGVEMQPAPFRRTFDTNAAIARAVTGDHALTPTYALSEAKDLRVNGVYGLKRALVPESWRLQLVGTQLGASHPRYSADVTAWEYRYTADATHEDQGHDTKVDPNMKTAEKMAPAEMMDQAKSQEDRAERMPRGREEAGESRSTLMPRTPGLLLNMDDILALPRHELVTQFKCIEGWSQISWWGGCRFSDFVQHYGLTAETALDYVGLSTPDDQYYAGIDTPSAMHPQTLLAYQMNDELLTGKHGQPLRLIIPVKYGIKNLKRIGSISFSNSRPRDYWAEQGYDYYSGL